MTEMARHPGRWLVAFLLLLGTGRADGFGPPRGMGAFKHGAPLPRPSLPKIQPILPKIHPIVPVKPQVVAPPAKPRVVRAAGAAGQAPVLYAIDSAGQLLWNEHLGYTDGSMRWSSSTNRVVGTGWGGFPAVFAGGQGSVYALRPNGDLAEYLHAGRASGTASWSGPKVVGNGWGDARLVFAASGGVIYAIMRNGDLRWYRHLGQASLTAKWEGGQTVGSGWGGFDLVVAGPDGVIYARTRGGQLLWYRHTGQATGAATWGAGSGNVVGSNRFRAMAAGPGGVLYGLQPNGDLLWYRHLGVADGSARWVGGGKGVRIGSGWTYRHLFGPPPESGGPPLVGASPLPPAPTSLAAALKGDSQAANLTAALQRPGVKAQLEAALARVRAADGKLGAAIRNLAGLARNPAGLLGQWKTKSVCGNVPSCTTQRKCVSVPNCWQEKVCFKVFGKRYCACVKLFGKRYCPKLKTVCGSPKQKCGNVPVCGTVRKCKSVRYFDLTAGKLYQAARQEAEKKARQARAAFDQLKKKIASEYAAAKKKLREAAAAAKAALAKAKSDAVNIAKKSWAQIQRTATQLWASASAGAKALFRKVFTFVAQRVLELIEPILARSAGALSLEARSSPYRFAGLLDELGLPERRRARAPSRSWCGAPRKTLLEDPLRQLESGITNSVRVLLLAAKRSQPGSWAKYLGIAEVERWKGWRPAEVRRATKASQAAEWLRQAPGKAAKWLRQALRVPRLIEVGEKLAAAARGATRAAKASWGWVQDLARGTGAAVKRWLGELADGVAGAAKVLGAKAQATLSRFGARIREAARGLVLNARQGLAARAAAVKAWVGRNLKPAWDWIARKAGAPIKKLLRNPSKDAARWVQGGATDGAFTAMKTKVLGLWSRFKRVAAPILSRMGSVAAGAGAKLGSAGAKLKALFKSAGSRIAQAAKKIGIGPLMVAVQWAVLAVAYPYADAECASAANYRACYVDKFNAFSKQAFFDAVVGTAMEGLDAALITPASVALTAAVSAAVAASFTPATAATAGAVIGLATKFGIVIGLTMAADLLFPWYDATFWKKGADVRAYFTARGDEGADLFSAFRLRTPDRNQGLLCQGRNFKNVGEAAGYDGLEMGNYGNWCGPGGTGKPLDAYDRCCRTHDKCYETHGCSITSDRCSAACYQCDRTAVQCWKDARRQDPQRFGSGTRLLYPCHACHTENRSLPALRSCNRQACFAPQAPGVKRSSGAAVRSAGSPGGGGLPSGGSPLALFLYRVAPDGSLRWSRSAGGAGGKLPAAVSPQRTVGSGWSFRHVFAGGHGSVYAVNGKGELLWYRHRGVRTGAAAWSGPVVVARGWGGYQHVFAGPNGIIYAVDAKARLLWYQHLGQATGKPQWRSPQGKVVGAGWGRLKHAFAGPAGVIYVIRANGDLAWYQHLGQSDGTFRWGARSGSVVGKDWGRFAHVFAGPKQSIYAVKPSGELLWYRHLGQRTGAFQWAPGSGAVVGKDWQGRRVFAAFGE